MHGFNRRTAQSLEAPLIQHCRLITIMTWRDTKGFNVTFLFLQANTTAETFLSPPPGFICKHEHPTSYPLPAPPPPPPPIQHNDSCSSTMAVSLSTVHYNKINTEQFPLRWAGSKMCAFAQTVTSSLPSSPHCCSQGVEILTGERRGIVPMVPRGQTCGTPVTAPQAHTQLV